MNQNSCGFLFHFFWGGGEGSGSIMEMLVGYSQYGSQFSCFEVNGFIWWEEGTLQLLVPGFETM